MSTASSVPSVKRSPRWARKSTVVLATTILALAVFGATTQTWIDVRLDPTGASNSDLHVQGSKAATAVTALAVVALAGGLAASIAGRIARWITAFLIALSAAGIIVAAVTVILDPLGAAQGSIAAATGVSGGQADATATVFPVLAIVAGALLAVCAIVLPLAGRHWTSRTKYDAGVRGRKSSNEPVDEIDSWDSLSRGEDPT
ncbi:Trp biosynthesis-associated membrane protein [Paenarthrobacter aurescens]|uniref:Trp biosynthesis-associated membrane protein n=1 Tax=Paenarthrobacter aurescens TaxID=43663 RepID=UPI001143058C|nr:Trp biosynthesis-associated membrane protein [Paenarthrobacter aurescens]MDO6143338.1 Trp biosynthesis-associated membrane protein [Paenarthrobacter aurescens]MDO6147186.1 Trp biosynthesis-associated membrane protein [Paenarthrobacter aurescens]MDO6158430.1 Trp biosynthesis-associated membrane protein [Paenarthrobacter aurescens]MDO6162414.1 Trp biosynthesis-associated membrane protein [Paenarthrobacter aurescens]